MEIRVNSTEELQTAVTQHERLMVTAGGSKKALSAPRPDTDVVDLSNLSGMLDYQPDEFTFTALAGTKLQDIEAKLAENNQFLPFDPPLVSAGATLGGTVAAGLSGPGRFRYGGVRDFILGVAFIDGQGRLVRSGGRVVKNAAGFDLSKLMVGSLGSYGALVELSFKVFPKPESTITLEAPFPDLDQALEAMIRVSRAPLDLYVLDLQPNSQEISIFARLGGPRQSLRSRIDRLRELIGQGKVIEGGDESDLWWHERHFSWVPADYALVKVALTYRQVADLEKILSQAGALRRYSAGANLAWIAWPGSLQVLDGFLSQLGLSGLVLMSEEPASELGLRKG
ncbi:MAG: FAD-binding protein, partial [Anaerolineales bacterium]